VGVEVHPREGLVSPPFPGFELYAVAAARPILHATDDLGRDVTERLRDLDRRFVDDLPLEPVRGYAKTHALTLNLGPVEGGGLVEPPTRRDASLADMTNHGLPADPGLPRDAFPVDAGPQPAGLLLMLTGWTDYAFSSNNIAAQQAGLTLTPPSLEARTPGGDWVTVVKEIGIPVGRPQTVVVDLTGTLPRGTSELRIVTSMRIYWDQIRVGIRSSAAPRVTRLDTTRADLRWRGFSAELTPDGREPFGYDYDRVSSQSPWKVLPGRYTREGPVGELLAEVDDCFVVSRPGDELALSFDATRVPPLRKGWTRTFLLRSVGYSKEMDRNSASPDRTWPLPFRAMTRYPYAPPEHYPDTPKHREYQEQWNTRIVSRPVPSIDLAQP
jgi:hypothetical protein